MKSLQNLNRVTYTNETIMTLIELYKFHGKEFHFKDLLKTDAEYYQRNTIEKDSFCLAEFFNLNVSENRMRLIISKNSEPKTNDEKIVRNIRDIVKICNTSPQNFEHSSGTVLSLVDRLFKDVKRTGFALVKETGKASILQTSRGKDKRDYLDEMFDLFKVHSGSGKNEITNLICNFYIDFINIKPFKESNEFIGIMLLYVLLLRHGFTQLKYLSFTEVLRERKDDFAKYVAEANYQWETGFAKVEPLNQFVISILLENYAKFEKIVADRIFDSNLRKLNQIEITVHNGPEIFTKEYIQKLNPSTSKSTIDRALSKMKEEGTIVSLGTGRSARWHKVKKNNDDFSLENAINIFSDFTFDE